MEPFEWLLLGAGLVVGSLFGANSKGIMKSAARGYLTIEEKTREWSANMREDMRDAIEEARYEREIAEAELEELRVREQEVAEALTQPEPKVTRTRTRRAKPTPAASATTTTQNGATRKPGRKPRAKSNTTEAAAPVPSGENA